MIEPSDFLDLADKLSSDPELGEASYRTAISRAYYAAFHEVVQRYANKKGLELSNLIFENHQNFIRKLKEERSFGEFRKIGNQLHGLKKDRTRADYKLDQDIATPMVKKSITISRKIFTESRQI